MNTTGSEMHRDLEANEGQIAPPANYVCLNERAPSMSELNGANNSEVVRESRVEVQLGANPNTPGAEGGDMRMKEAVLGRVAIAYLVYALLLFPVLKCGYIIWMMLVDMEADLVCMLDGCNTPTMTDKTRALVFMEYIVVFLLSVGSLLVGCLVFSKYPNIPRRSFQNHMKIFGAIYVTEIIFIALGLLTNTANDNLLAIGTALIVTEGIAVNMGFCQRLHKTNYADGNSTSSSGDSSSNNESQLTPYYPTITFWGII